MVDFRMKNSNDAWITVCQHCYVNNAQDKLRSFTQLVDGSCAVCDSQFFNIAG